MKHVFHESILKQYDIRGIVNQNLNEQDAYFVGKSYGTLLQEKFNRRSCVVGYDARTTSEPYSRETIRGLRECNIEVTDLGLVTTPMVYFALQFLRLEAGLMVTASHNPPEYNGFKMLTNEDPIWGNDIKKLGEISKNGKFFTTNTLGNLRQKSLKRDYFDFLKNILVPNPPKTLKICWDPGNGTVAAILDDLLRELPHKHLSICNTIDANFPNHHPNPEVPENMKMLAKAVVENDCDLGIGFDGDGDRLGVVDSTGCMLFGDQLLCIFARDFLRKNPGEKVMSEVSSSLVLYDDIVLHGGIPVMWKPGHSIQKAKMKSDNIRLAGETSGHIFFGENHNYDDALYASLKLLNILAVSRENLVDIRNSLPKTFVTKKINIKSTDIDKFRVPIEIAERLLARNREVCTVEGVRVKKADGWWLCRNSSTGPQLTIRCEALSEEGLKACQQELQEQLALAGYKVEF
jgi:phosphomannomutase